MSLHPQTLQSHLLDTFYTEKGSMRRPVLRQSPDKNCFASDEMSLELEQQEITKVSLHKHADQAVLENKQTGGTKKPG